jgi:hypothetical protein
MKLSLRIEPAEGKLYACCEYEKIDVLTSHFYINRDFNIIQILCDDQDLNISPEFVNLDIFDGYEVQEFTLPNFDNKLQIKYSGFLSGKTGCCPYAKEQITSNFTFLRWETFYYPIFINDEQKSLIDFLGLSGNADINIDVPKDYEVVASEKGTGKTVIDCRKHFYYSGEKITKYNFNCAIARYNYISTAVGSFYMFDTFIGYAAIENTMKKAHAFMNEHFGRREITSSVKYVSIPDGFGSFACSESKVVFIQESTFRSIKDMNQIIHEFIHLGWNVKTDKLTQRIRFFDEAFTSYFEMRVMENIIGENYLHSYYSDLFKNSIYSKRYKVVPICEFGQYEYGDLSYTIGALCLHELCSLVGTKKFDEVTTIFLEKYKNEPVTLDVFCEEYASLCGKENKFAIEQFFIEWLYSCKGYEKYL